MRESDSPCTEDEVFNYKSIRRLGKPDTNPKHPIRLIMNNENEKDQIMKNLNKLKNTKDLRK